MCGFRHVWLDVGSAASGLAPLLFWFGGSGIVSFAFFLTSLPYV